MKISKHIKCKNFPCTDVNQKAYLVPQIEIDPRSVRIMMISEGTPEKEDDFFYSHKTSLYSENTLNAFRDAEIKVKSITDILDLGIYLTTAIKCGRVGDKVSAKTIETCSKILEKEISLFPNVECYLLMGDVAIKGFNYISKRNTGEKAIPPGSTYKIRKDKFFYKKKRVFPSYMQTGKNYLIEKSKRKMIAEDIEEAVRILNN